MDTRIAIPMFHDNVAPRFETAEVFFICQVTDGQQVDSEIVTCEGCAGIGRVRLLQDNNVQVLICNGIKNFYRDVLASQSIEVIDKISLSVSDAIRHFIAAQIAGVIRMHDKTPPVCDIPHDDMVCWARELFESHGYGISKPTVSDTMPIDLIASLTCPFCGKPICVAICCGAQLYRTDIEIRAFHHALSSQYHAAVYVHPKASTIEETCSSYGIQFLDPYSEPEDVSAGNENTVPLLLGPIAGHDRIGGGGKSPKEYN
ncbi:MAG: NifB/NifX family molybdenum-iron cluster-binding protein [Candidatus Zixiibacteriota bacterium]